MICYVRKDIFTGRILPGKNLAGRVYHITIRSYEDTRTKISSLVGSPSQDLSAGRITKVSLHRSDHLPKIFLLGQMRNNYLLVG